MDNRYFLLKWQALQGESPQDKPHTPTKRLLPPKSTLKVATFGPLVNQKSRGGCIEEALG